MANVTAEVVNWRENSLWLWTGTGDQSAQLGLVNQQSVTFAWGWDNRAKNNNTYADVLTGERVDLQVGQALSYHFTILAMAQSATAYHLKIEHSSETIGTAGHILYSGRFDRISQNGNDGGTFNYSFAYHSNSWTAFGNI